MNSFEKTIEATFAGYEARGQAHLFILHPPMRPCGMHGKMPAYVPVGKAPYDISGYYIGDEAQAIGVELKETSEHESALSIIQPDKRGSGLQYHQLRVLVELHKAGGMAVLLWNNGGEIGRAGGDVLSIALIGYEASLKSRNPTKGSRSIKFGLFTPVQLGINSAPMWLPDRKLK